MSKTTKPVQFLFVDLETDGTNAQGGNILEVSCFLTDNKLNRIGDGYHSLVLPQTDLITVYNNMHGIVQKMHTDNGLWKDLEDLKVNLEIDQWKKYHVRSVEIEILNWLNGLWPEGAPVAEIRMAGHSINSLDFPFIREHMPELASNLSHRTLDISSYVRFITDCCEISNDEIPFGLKEAGHRAADDNLMAIREAKKLREWVIMANGAIKTFGLNKFFKNIDE